MLFDLDTVQNVLGCFFVGSICILKIMAFRLRFIYNQIFALVNIDRLFFVLYPDSYVHLLK